MAVKQSNCIDDGERYVMCNYFQRYHKLSQSRWACGLRCRSTAALFLE